MRAYLQFVVRGANPGVGGHPLLDNIIYVDMDSDGVEEAVITLNSGGTAGNIGFLVYRQATAAPQLAAWHDGYKLGLVVEDGQLVARNARYAGWEPNCCPSGFSFDTYILQGQQLQLVAIVRRASRVCRRPPSSAIMRQRAADVRRQMNGALPSRRLVRLYFPTQQSPDRHAPRDALPTGRSNS